MNERPPCKYCGKPCLFHGQPLRFICDACAHEQTTEAFEEMGRKVAQRFNEKFMEVLFSAEAAANPDISITTEAAE